MRPGIAFAGQTDALTIARAGLDSHFDRLSAVHHSFTVARRTTALGLPRPMAARALHAELHAPATGGDLASASTFRAIAHCAHTTLRSEERRVGKELRHR